MSALTSSDTWAVGTYDIERTATDGAANASSCTQVLTVADVTAPEVSCGDTPRAFPATLTPTATDACGATPVISNIVWVDVDRGS